MKVAVIAGGVSLERQLSLRSGRRVLDALRDQGLDARHVDLDDAFVPTMADGGFDVAFLALHGKAGEDGTVQSLLEVLEVPYTGPDAIASAMAWDKGVAKGLFQRAGLHTPPWVALSATAIRDMGGGGIQDRLLDRTGTPLVVKPAQGGAFMGVRFVGSPAEMPAALVGAFSYGDTVLVERFIHGTEIAVSIADDRVYPAVEIVPKAGVYDFAARYTAGATDFYAPARLDEAVLAGAADAARRAWDVIGCRHIARVDMIVDADGTPWILEIDTCPGLTSTSLLPLAVAAADEDIARLCRRLVESAAAAG